VGDFVYLQHEMVDTLDTRAGARILRVKEVAPNGVLELEGSDARTVRVHMERCAPCYRVDIDDHVDPRVAVPPGGQLRLHAVLQSQRGGTHAAV
jgi:hypothetical protein